MHPQTPPEATRCSTRARRGYLLLSFATGVFASSCEVRAPAPGAEAEFSCGAAGSTEVIERLGERLKRVSLQAPDSIVVREIQEAYAPLVTPALLDAWIAEPSNAPGRDLSSPWPERIEVRSVKPAGARTCRVEGEIVYVTSVELAQGGVASRVPVTLEVVENRGWRISAYEAGSSPPTSDSADTISAPTDAGDVLRDYYAAINARDFRRAYELWSNDGSTSGQTFEEFAAGFAETARVEVEVGEAGPVEGAAGSRYVTLPVVIRAVTKGGEAQRFEGTYTLRRSVVDGASAEQRRWHIYSADIDRTR